MMRGEDRKHQFKKQADAENGRRRREETTTQIRKAKREEQLMKRRQAIQATPLTNNNEEETKYIYTKEDIPRLMSVYINGPKMDDEILKATQGFRRMLSVEVNPPVNEVLAAGALPYLARLLNKIENTDIVFEAAWALTNIASTDKTAAVAQEPGVLEQLIRLLQHNEAQIREQAAWCLGNFAGDSADLRDLVLQAGALKGLIMNLNEPGSMSLLSNVAWAVSNLCRGKPSPNMNYIAPAIAPLAGMLRRDVSKDVLVDTVWALSYLADGENERIDALMNTDPGLAAALVAKLKDAPLDLLTPVVRTLGNFVTGSDEQTQAVVDAGVIQHMTRLLEHTNRNIRKESCWLLSNVAAGSKSQLQMVIKAPGLIEQVIQLVRDDRWEVRKEALWVLVNIFTTGDDYHVRALVQRDGFAALVEALESTNEAKMLIVMLEAIEAILKLGNKLNLNYVHMLDEYGGVDFIEELQNHNSEAVYEKAIDILEKYLGVEDDEDENLAPSENNGFFSFGMNPSTPAKELFPSENDKYAPSGLGESNAPLNFSMEY